MLMVNVVKMSNTCSLILAQIPRRHYCSLIMYIIRGYSVTECIPLFCCSLTAFQHLIDCTDPCVHAVSRAHGCRIHYTKTSKHFLAGVFPDKSGSNAIFNAIIGLHVVWMYRCTSSCITFMKSRRVLHIYAVKFAPVKSWIFAYLLLMFFVCFILMSDMKNNMWVLP